MFKGTEIKNIISKEKNNFKVQHIQKNHKIL
jgi:hypothetical protein